jgi:8-oxo-dGTP pyrophosphatase MutT (NUDIX family)
MPIIKVDTVDAYVFRRLHGKVQFLLIQRRLDVPLGGSWVGFHTTIESGERAVAAAKRAIRTVTALEPDQAFSADFVNHFYNYTTDEIVFSPVFAFTVPRVSSVSLSDDFAEFAWLDRDEATRRLAFSGQRWAVRHIEEIIGLGGIEAELYRIGDGMVDPQSKTGK